MILVKCIYQGMVANLKEGHYYAAIQNPFFPGEYILPLFCGTLSVFAGKHHFVIIK